MTQKASQPGSTTHKTPRRKKETNQTSQSYKTKSEPTKTRLRRLRQNTSDKATQIILCTEIPRLFSARGGYLCRSHENDYSKIILLYSKIIASRMCGCGAKDNRDQRRKKKYK